MVLNIVLLCICLITSIMFTVYRQKNTGIMALMLKTLASTTLVISAIILSYKNGLTLYSLFITIGMLFGLLGDIFLDLKAVYKNDEKPFLCTGIGCFMIGHISYLLGILFVLKSISEIYWIWMLIIIIISLLMTLIIYIFSKKNNIDFNKYKYYVLIYTFILCYMTCLGSLSFILNYHMWPLVIGFILFLASDSLLSFIYFGSKKEDKVYCLINHILYYFAQIFIVFSIIFIV